MDVKTINNIEKAPTTKPGKLTHKKRKTFLNARKKRTQGRQPPICCLA